ncbi:MAG TPA: hypothetical protein EYP65_03200 [Armatimonadetes bacterium]|nr:hypothetical protein [Armatimonadota bacterium]
MKEVVEALAEVVERAREEFDKKDASREEALRLCREVTRNSAKAIKHAHRGEWEEAEGTLKAAGEFLAHVKRILKPYPELLYSGFVQDAEREYSEAALTLSLVRGKSPPTPEELGVEVTSYLNGLAEAMGELRRHVVDKLRAGLPPQECEPLISLMDEVYYLLVGLDYPEAMLQGLRRRVDILRGLIEKTRSDVASAAMQRELEEHLRRIRREAEESGKEPGA